MSSHVFLLTIHNNLSLYADDVVVFFENLGVATLTLMSVCVEFGRISGFNIN